MAKVEWSAGIDSVSGALAKPGKSPQHRCSKMLLGTHRVAATQSKDCNRMYIRKPTNRTTPLSSNEIAARARFSAVAAAVKVRAKDLMKMTEDQAAFIAQKDLADGKTTMRAYLWSVCGAEYDAQHA